MKAKRIVAWLLVCVLQLGVCLLIPLRGRQLEQNIEKNGESYRFAVRMVTRSWDERRSEVDVDFPLTAYNGDDWKDTIVRVLETDADYARAQARAAECLICYGEQVAAEAEGTVGRIAGGIAQQMAIARGVTEIIGAIMLV